MGDFNYQEGPAVFWTPVLPLITCLQSQGTMPTAGDTYLKNCTCPQEELKTAIRTWRQNGFPGTQDSYPEVSFISVAPTEVQSRQKYLVQKVLTC